MLTYPQLESGAVTHFPVEKLRTCRTLVNNLPDGRQVRFADTGGDTLQWRLSYSGLTDLERSTLEDFFVAAEGRLKTFVFLDPMGNLLAWSEDPNNDVWTRDPLLVIEDAVQDPEGSTRASRVSNTSGASQRLTQTVEAPADYMYTLSVFSRSEGPQMVTLLRGPERRAAAVRSTWTRLTWSGKNTGNSDSIEFGLELPAGTSIEIFGFQVEAQSAASGYKRSEAQSGVYPEARFRDDALSLTTEGPDQHSGVIQIIHANHL